MKSNPVRHLFLAGSNWRWKPGREAIAAGLRSQALGPDYAKAVAAADILNRKLDAWKAGEYDPSPAPSRTVADLFVAYRESASWPTHPTTQAQYLRNLNAIQGTRIGDKTIGERAPISVTPPLVDRLYRLYRDTKGQRSANYLMTVFGQAWSTAVRLELAEGDPFASLRLPTPPPRKQVWSPEDITAFATMAQAMGKPELALLVELAYDIGLRPSDLRDLTWDEWTGHAFELTTKKRGVDQHLEVDPTLAERLNAMPRHSVYVLGRPDDGSPYPQSTFNVTFAQVRDAAGIAADKRCNDIRRTVATELFEAGVSAAGVKDVLGHADIRTSNNYNVTNSRKVLATEALRTRRGRAA